MIIKTDRKEIDKSIKELKLFNEAPKALQAYKEEVANIEAEEAFIREELAKLEKELADNLASQEVAGVGQKVYLKMQEIDVAKKIELTKGVLAETTASKLTSKIKHAPLIRTAIGEDRGANSEFFDINAMVETYKYDLLKALSDMGQEVTKQYNEIRDDVWDVIQDDAVVEAMGHGTQIRYAFDRNVFYPSLSSEDIVLHRSHIQQAGQGTEPTMTQKVKEAKGIDDK
ncbi:hypothetical protein [Peribacillus sp. NPDC058075]|uniref:hypothetical protein n=1 Tax=unclassified Peribacillus TaxID=2675266 RepID=UPI0036DEDDA7